MKSEKWKGKREKWNMKYILLILFLIIFLKIPLLADIETISLPVNPDFIISSSNKTIANSDKSSSADGHTEDTEGIDLIEGEYIDVIKPEDLEKGYVQIEMDFVSIPYKDNTATENYFPVLIRIDTGPQTELRIFSSFLEYQSPAWGFNDVSAGFKWNFREENPSMGLLGTVTFPSGSGGFGDGAPEPGVAYLIDYQIKDKWDLSGTVLVLNNMDSNSKERYNQIISGMQIGYTINDDHYVFISGGVKYPNKDPGGVGLTNLNAGYTVNLHDNLQMTLNVTGGLSSIDKAWLFNIGVNYRLK